ncbi:MAG: adenylosuccinate synthetase, partial [Oscillospiraceae bacterium]
MIKAIVGANWGDEGKGKITDALAEQADIVIRFQGGANAGHTIINEYGKFALHQLPSGVFHKHIVNIIGNGVAFSVENFITELEGIISKGVPEPIIMISDRTQLVMPYHKLLDTYEEERLAGKSFGSTRSGIAPFYSDKYAKIGFQLNEIFADDDYILEKAERVCAIKNVLLEHLYHKPALVPSEIFDTLKGYRKALEPFVTDTFAYLYDANN